MKMSAYVHNFKNHLVIDIEKAIYTHEEADTVRVNEKYIKQAVHNCQFLVIRSPMGEKQFLPKQLKKDGKRVKEVFLFPDNPMIMYEIKIPHSEKSDLDKFRWL